MTRDLPVSFGDLEAALDEEYDEDDLERLLGKVRDRQDDYFRILENLAEREDQKYSDTTY